MELQDISAVSVWLYAMINNEITVQKSKKMIPIKDKYITTRVTWSSLSVILLQFVKWHLKRQDLFVMKNRDIPLPITIAYGW